MSLCITFGNYNKAYKYIWIYIIIKISLNLFFGSNFPEDIKIYLNKVLFPQNILVQETFNYIGIVLFTMILWTYKLRQNKNIKLNNSHVTPVNSSKHSSEINLIYNEGKNNIKEVSVIFLISIVFLLFLSNQLNHIFNIFELKGLDYWMFEIAFICYISVHIFKITIYLHKKVAICIIIIFSTAMKVISTYIIINNNSIPKLYNKYTWIIPVGIISFILIIFIRGYSFCRLKWIFDLKYISEIKILLIYGIIGSILCLIGSIISSNIQCIDQNHFIDIKFICKVKNGTYYDNFNTYFKGIWKEDRNGWINIIYVILMLNKIFASFLSNYLMALIIKYLSPEYLICSKYIFYFITELLTFIIDNYNSYILFNLLAEVFAILGAFLYLEFIELKFYKMDYYLKKNIMKRSSIETNLDIIGGFNDNDSERND